MAVAGNTDVSGNGTFGGDLTVEGKTTLKDLLQVEGDAEFKKNASVGGDLSVTGTSNLKDTNVDGKLDVTGESAFHDNVTMDKDLSVAGNADVAGNSHVGKDLTVDGKTTLKDLLQVEGDAEFKKNASVGGDLSVTGTSNLHDTNVDGKLDVTGESAFHDNVTMDKDLSVAGNAGVDKNLTVKGKSDLQGDVAVGGKLDVAGESTFKENVSMEKDLAVAGNADVAGNGSFGGDLTVEGKTTLKDMKTTLKDMLSVTGDAEFQSNASVGKDLTVEGTSNIHDTNIDGKLDVTGESKFHDNVTMDKSLTVSGKTTTGELEVNGNANVGGTLTADKVVANDIQLPGGSLNRRMDNMDTRIDKVGAGAAALAGLQYAEFDPGSKFSMAMGMGHYKGKTAAAVGGQYHFSKNVSMNLAGTIGNGENMVSAGLTFRFGAPRSKYQKDNNDALRAENDMLNKRLKAVEKKIQSLSLITDKRAGFPDVDKGHWANKAVETLHGNGFVQGYPDGKFKGDRQMTRYEYAEMLYNALSKGAKVDQAQLEEYAPELHKINAERVRGNKPKNNKKSSQGITTTTVQQDADTQAFGQAYNANHPR